MDGMGNSTLECSPFLKMRDMTKLCNQKFAGPFFSWMEGIRGVLVVLPSS